MKATHWLLLYFLCVAYMVKGQALQTVEQVDPDKYLGRWYDIASFPATFQKDCHCTTADYERVDPGCLLQMVRFLLLKDPEMPN